MEPNSYQPPSAPSPQTNFPILAIAIIGILTTAFLLVSYYIFVIKCCLNLHRFNFLRPFVISRAQQRGDPVIVYTSPPEICGLDDSLIRAIPILEFKQAAQAEEEYFFECAVCLNEFQEEEKLRVLPNCAHAFHIDCIDIWLQNNANCPLCRSNIPTTRFPINQMVAQNSSPQDANPYNDTVISGDENFVVIEVGNEDILRGELAAPSITPSPRKFMHKKSRKLHQVSSMGDECINVRAKDNQFSLPPIRRSISMDSSTDRQLYFTVQEIIQEKRHLSDVTTNEGCSSSAGSRMRLIFSFRGSINAILPIHLEQQNQTS